MRDLGTVFLLSTALLLITAAGCATAYGPKGLTGGYSETKLARDMFLVTFEGNGYTNEHTVKQYFFRRCAELTIQNGFDYFVLLEAQSGTDNVLVPLPGTYSGTTSVYGTSATTHGTYIPGPIINVAAPRVSGMIKILKKEQAAALPMAISAEDLLSAQRVPIPPLSE